MPEKTFKTQLRIKFRDADPVKIMYFANIFDHAHDIFEEFIINAGFTWQDWFARTDFGTPFRHVESEFLAPMLPGQIYEVSVMIPKLGESSFQTEYTFYQKSQVHAKVRMTHVFVDFKTQTKVSIPDSIRQKLHKYFKPAS
jgi:acyl-CoA thioester hydrolase/1,4-dihydroxy-2-naphthoyl-CoA hydrolase